MGLEEEMHMFEQLIVMMFHVLTPVFVVLKDLQMMSGWLHPALAGEDHQEQYLVCWVELAAAWLIVLLLQGLKLLICSF